MRKPSDLAASLSLSSRHTKSIAPFQFTAAMAAESCSASPARRSCFASSVSARSRTSIRGWISCQLAANAPSRRWASARTPIGGFDWNLPRRSTAEAHSTRDDHHADIARSSSYTSSRASDVSSGRMRGTIADESQNLTSLLGAPQGGHREPRTGQNHSGSALVLGVGSSQP